MLVEGRVGGRTVTFRHEPGDSPTLVFLHGASSNYRIYDRLIDALEGWNRVALSFPGRAGTEGPPLDCIESMADYTAAVVRSVVKGRYVLIGYSMGGAVVMECAIRGDEGLVGAVLMSTGARLRVNPLAVKMYETACRVHGELLPAPAAAFEDGADRALIEEAAEHRSLTPVETAATDWRACDGFDRMEVVHRIEVPALILGGTDDVLAPPKFSEFLGSTIVENELHLVSGAGHMMVMERAPEIAPLIASFASQLRFDATEPASGR